MADNKSILQAYLFEIIERTARFYIHLDEIKNQFYFEAKSRVDDKLIFLQSYKDCLLKYVEIAFLISKKIDLLSFNETLEQTKKLIISINHLHRDYLMHLPRPSEPIELKRFTRIIDKQVLNLKDALGNSNSGSTSEAKISIYLSEEVGESTFIRDPVFEFKETEINNLIQNHNEKYEEAISRFKKDENDSGGFHISIPRIDANNPCRWPTLLHEVAHKVMKNEFFDGKSIDDDFISTLDIRQIKFIEEMGQDINLKSWLIECWCDLFACIATGPAFWFSQFSAFIFQEKDDLNTINKDYPKALFRLKLIQRILEHRFENVMSERLIKSMRLAEGILVSFDKMDKCGFYINDDIRQLFLYFRIYFFLKFFQKGKKRINK